MSAPSGGAASAPQCACTNISIMQLFHELKQQFPGIPDHVVSTTISSHCHDRSACQLRLQCEAKKYISQLYPSSSLSGGKKERKDILCPQQCPNQLIIAKEINKPKRIQLSSVKAQRALCSYTKLDENQNENILKDEIIDEEEQTDSEEDANANIEEKQSDFINPDKIVVEDLLEKDDNFNSCPTSNKKTFQIIKSNKVTSDLNKKLFDHNTKQDEITLETLADDNKIKRPTTLEFSAEPQLSGFDIKSHKESFSAPATFPDTSQKLQDKINDSTSCKCQHKCEKSQEKNDQQTTNERFPLNVSVNLNCRMDVRPSGNRTHHSHFQEPWRGSYSNPTNITSVNLTVCTPTGVSEDLRNPPLNNSSDPRQRGFEGHVQITVSPASAHPPSFRGPSSAISQTRSYFSPNIMPESSSIDNLLRRQRERLQRLQNALAAERSRLVSMQREVSLLKEPPSNNTASRLWPDVQHLRKLCQKLTSQLDRYTATRDGEFYDNIYTGQQQTSLPIGPQHRRHHTHQQQQQQQHLEEQNSSWQCHLCTFRNNALLNNCEECDMPRIVLVHANEEIRVEVAPGRNSKILHYQN